jgi:hypothetical protein
MRILAFLTDPEPVGTLTGLRLASHPATTGEQAEVGGNGVAGQPERRAPAPAVSPHRFPNAARPPRRAIG